MYPKTSATLLKYIHRWFVTRHPSRIDQTKQPGERDEKTPDVENVFQ